MKSLSPTTLGMLLALLAYAVYAFSDAMVKGLGGSLGPFEIGFITTLFSIIPAAMVKPKEERWRDTFKLAHPWLVHAIALLRTISAVSITYSFVSIPLAEAYSLVFLIPVFTTILSVLVLRETVTLDRWALILVSFVGVMLVVRPGFRELHPGHLTALFCAICAALSIICMRMVSGKEKRTTLFVMPGLYTLAANGAVLLVTGVTLPDWTLLVGLVACGVLGGIGYLLQIVAVAKAPASRIVPTQYSQIVWALLLGALFFAEFPDAVGIAGLGVVVAAGIANVFVDGARARIAGRWSEYRGRRERPGPTGFQGPGPDPV